ncbi:hypothetical protein [Flavobacterium sp. GSB-24]|uniref:hypothetical protein n=1 Tax=Flavobacterium sp. GSB-24 TaxID=2994319 RepID=UPI00248F4E59|nr:hypothetical protein [Flavobacterium sp. GSB-24]
MENWMMDKARSAFLDQVLIALSSNYFGSVPFEEIMEVFYSISSTAVSSSSAIENEAKILDALLELEILGLVVVNYDTDESSLTDLGLEWVRGKILLERLGIF